MNELRQQSSSNKGSTASAVAGNIGSIIRGKDKAIELILVALLSGGHVLVEDIPGVGKTTLALALARSIRCPFRRIQFTNDTIPADILGMMVFSRKEESFRFVPGPIFAGVVLADEINRSSPKTQSALLQAMTEGKVSIENNSYRLPEPFMVIATQNPIESHGTFPLPESQLDRFLIRVSLGYPDIEAEKEILSRDIGPSSVAEMKAVTEAKDIMQARAAVSGVTVEDSLLDYILAIAKASRKDRRLSLGASPRGVLMLKKSSQALAFIRGREFVLPDDIKAMALPVLTHRLRLADGNGQTGIQARETEAVLSDIIDSTPVPI